MCWHSYKLLDKKSNILPLFSSLHTKKFRQSEIREPRLWMPSCRWTFPVLGLKASGARRTWTPVWRASEVVSLSPSLSYNWSQWLFSFQEYFPLGWASGTRVGSGVELFLYPLSNKRLPVEQLSQDTNNWSPYSFENNSSTLASGKPGSLLAQKGLTLNSAKNAVLFNYLKSLEIIRVKKKRRRQVREQVFGLLWKMFCRLWLSCAV